MEYGETARWEPVAPRLHLLRVLVSWAILTLSVYVAAGLVPGVGLERPGAGSCCAAAGLPGLSFRQHRLALVFAHSAGFVSNSR